MNGYICGGTSLTSARLRLCHIKNDLQTILSEGGGIKSGLSVCLVMTEPLVALISAAQCSSQQQIMESGSGGVRSGGGGG